ncbi:MAG: hypothetical protein KBF32_07545 [Chitinophagales bacterium]|nr:hypothetical protein [Chitinophagaceae bacterium]MBP9883240.1 hypothetical protein [Chitinophagales bacterium]
MMILIIDLLQLPGAIKNVILSGYELLSNQFSANGRNELLKVSESTFNKSG